MKRIAAPMVGGLATSAFLTLELIPVVYTYWRQCLGRVPGRRTVPPRAGETPAMRVLLAEDDQLLGEGVRAGLAQAGFAIAWVQDGEKAKLTLATEPFDAVVLDLGLPRLDGLSVLRQLRAKGNPVPVRCRCTS